MKFGCCTNMLIREPGSVGEEYLERLAGAGYDYVELPLGDIAGLSQEKLSQLKALSRQTLPVYACNNFFPNEIHLCGEAPTPFSVVQNYYKNALCRAAELGVQVAVFGSPWAKACPEGFPKTEAFKQLTSVCRALGEEASQYEITIALEPNNRLETNMINTYSDVLALIKATDHPRIQGLQDYFHLKQEEDTVASLIEGKEHLVHTHFARFEGRRFPKSMEEDSYYPVYFQALKDIGYQGGVSMEGFIENKECFGKEAIDTINFFHAI